MTNAIPATRSDIPRVAVPPVDRDLRTLVLRRTLQLSLSGCALFAFSYVATQRFAPLPYLLPYAIPSAIALAASYRFAIERVAEWLLYYLVILTLGLRFLCEASYPVDFVIFPVFAAGAFFLLTPRRAVILTLIHFVGLLAVSMVVFVAPPFDLVFVASELPYSIWIAFLLAGGTFTIFAHHISRESSQRLERLRFARIELQHLTDEYRNLLSTLLHDSANDLLAARWSLDALPDDGSGRVDDARAAIGSLQSMIDNLRRLKAAVGVTSAAEASPLTLADLHARLAMAHSERLSTRGFTLLLDGERDLSALVEPLTFSVHVVGNLLGNAIKYGVPGTVIRLSGEVLDDAVRITLTNAVEHERFDALAAVLSGATPAQESSSGQGLGLHIARTFCRTLGYELETRVTAVEGTRGTVAVTVVVPHHSADG